MASNFKYVFILLMQLSLLGITTTQLQQQNVKRLIKQAIESQSTNNFIASMESGFTNNLAITPLAFAVQNAQQKTGLSIADVVLNYGMTGYPQYPTTETISVIVDKNAYIDENLPPFITIDSTIFKTIQEAINNIEYTTDANEKIATIFIAEGIYEENIVLPPIRTLNIVFIGKVELGTTAAPKNVTLEFENNATPAQIVNFLPLECINTKNQNFFYPSSFIITGNLLFGDNEAALTADTLKEISLTNILVSGETKHGNTKMIGQTYIYLTNCIFNEAFNLYSSEIIGYNLTFLVQAYACQFKKYLSIDQYGRMLHCKLSQGLSVASTITTTLRTFYPYAFINSIVNGVVQGISEESILEFYLDQYTEDNSSYSLNNATKTIVESDS